MHVVVVNGNEALDGRWKSVGEGLVADGSFCKCGVAVQVLVKDKAVRVEVREDPHQSMWWLKGVYFGQKRLVCREVGGRWRCRFRSCRAWGWLRWCRVCGVVCL